MSLAGGYLKARGLVIEAGYGNDIAWAERLAFVKPDAGYICREAAFVILNSGFRFQVAQKLWPGLLRVFHSFDPELVTEACIEPGLAILKHPGKLGAMVKMAELLRREGTSAIIESAKRPLELTRLPWIGKITCYHLAKVLGADVIKPDVHLVRAGVAARATSALALCEAIRDELGERLTVIDSVLWRYGEQQRARGWVSWETLWAT